MKYLASPVPFDGPGQVCLTPLVLPAVQGSLQLFTLLTQKFAEIDKYKHEDWKSLFDQLFNHLEDDDIVGVIATVQTAMDARGLFLGSEPTDQHPIPSES